ncbi:response regulator [Agaribacter marinus]|uniref:DNA-binding response regulator n=1 Tax=Agaribacter marinus TaxID=1431249 RepID=A0AA37T2V6_9ALTE|nr:response regulator transcription factor [Agaribacter marinus]GLR73005.1 DNA-binding response regulator [Agaribacter marinus]
MKIIRVMTVDDHEIVRQGINSFINTQENIRIVGEADSSKSAISVAKTIKPDVILMDLQLEHHHSGIEATEAIKQQIPNCEIIILTSYYQDDYIFPALASGALSYLLKDVSPVDLVDAIVKAANKQTVLSPIVANRILKEHYKPAIDPFISLTEREQAILKLIAQGLNNTEISEQLFISIKTVRSHVSNILSKLQLRDRTQAAVMAWQQGIMS